MTGSGKTGLVTVMVEEALPRRHHRLRPLFAVSTICAYFFSPTMICMRGRILFFVAAGVAVVAACTSSSSTGTTGSSQAADTNRACSVPSDCALVFDHCCGDTNVAVNKDAAIEFEKSACPVSGPCPNAGAGAVHQAVCHSGTCTAIDLRSDPRTACTTDDDCILRCPDCRSCIATAFNVVALAKSGEAQYLADICPTGCSTCAAPPSPDASVRARCNLSTGHCKAVDVLPDGGDSPL